MSEIAKLYENAGVEKRYNYIGHYPETDEKGIILPPVYPPFTAEKVLKVIVFFLNKGIRLDFSVVENTKISVENFKECIAQIGAKYWQDLTEEERAEIKNILQEDNQ